MNVFLWIIQILFALHTAMGGIWKFTNPISTVPTLAALPSGSWVILGILELLAAGALIAPIFNKSWAVLIPIAALFILAEMLLFTALHLSSGARFNGQVTYWLVVAGVGAFIAWGRLSLRPL